MCSFHFYRVNQFKLIPLACMLRTRNVHVFPNFSNTLDAATIDTFVVTRWRRELHTTHYTEGCYFIYNSGE